MTLLLASWFVNTAALTLYEEPRHHGHIVDEIRYGTEVTLSQEEGPWVYLTYPQYAGWALKTSLLEHDPLPTNSFVGIKGAYLYQEMDTEWGPVMTLPFETPLQVIEESSERWRLVQLQDGTKLFVQRFYTIDTLPKLSLDQLSNFAKQFLGLKYLWGGSTSFGYDCSGFVRMLYRQMQIELPRDAWQIHDDPRLVSAFAPQPGDLIFFKNRSSRVVHVGMMMSDQEFIHAWARQGVTISSCRDPAWQPGGYYASIAIKRFPLN